MPDTSRAASSPLFVSRRGPLLSCPHRLVAPVFAQSRPSSRFRSPHRRMRSRSTLPRCVSVRRALAPPASWTRQPLGPALRSRSFFFFFSFLFFLPSFSTPLEALSFSSPAPISPIHVVVRPFPSRPSFSFSACSLVLLLFSPFRCSPPLPRLIPPFFPFPPLLSGSRLGSPVPRAPRAPLRRSDRFRCQ